MHSIIKKNSTLSKVQSICMQLQKIGFLIGADCLLCCKKKKNPDSTHALQMFPQLTDYTHSVLLENGFLPINMILYNGQYHS